MDNDLIYTITGILLGVAGTIAFLKGRHAGVHRAPLHLLRRRPKPTPEPARGVAAADTRPAALREVPVPQPPRMVVPAPLPRPVPQNAEAINEAITARIDAGLPPWTNTDTARIPRIADATELMPRQSAR